MEKINLDLKDKKILNILEMNAKISYSSLSRKVKLSKQVVKYRVDKLIKQNIIQQFYPIIDTLKLNKIIYIIYFKFKHLSNKEENKWIQELKQNKDILTVGKNAGTWDLTIVVLASDKKELNKILNQVIKNKEEYILENKITSQITSTYFNSKIFYNKNIKETITKGGKIEKIDKIDNIIIKELSKDCRISLVELSRQLKLTANGIKARIKNLEKREIIVGYKTKINYEKLEYLHFRVFLHIENFDSKLYLKFKNFLKNTKGIESITQCFGYANLDFRCHVKNILELYEITSKIKDKFASNIIYIDSVINFNWESMNYWTSK